METDSIAAYARIPSPRQHLLQPIVPRGYARPHAGCDCLGARIVFAQTPSVVLSVGGFRTVTKHMARASLPYDLPRERRQCSSMPLARSVPCAPLWRAKTEAPATFYRYGRVRAMTRLPFNCVPSTPFGGPRQTAREGNYRHGTWHSLRVAIPLARARKGIHRRLKMNLALTIICEFPG